MIYIRAEQMKRNKLTGTKLKIFKQKNFFKTAFTCNFNEVH